MNKLNISTINCFSVLRLAMFTFAACLVVSCASQSVKPASTVKGKSAPNLVRDTTYGKIDGKVELTTGNLIWRGIPFAKPPVADLRFKAPREPDKWSGVRITKKYAAKCIQLSSFSKKVTGSEDCLYLNITRPDTKEKDLPVYVWIHGGSNETGSGRMDLSYFAKEANVVAVNLQYRLGPIGFFKHDALNTGDPMDDSGNYGLLDQIMALRWVQKNIASFGGDVNNVTIGGQSAGGTDVMALLTTKVAYNLYQKAVNESGGGRIHPLDKVREQSAAYVSKIKLKSAGAELAKELRAYPAKKLLYKKPKGASFGPILDGVLIRGDRSCLYAKGDYNKVPILMGGNRNEYSTWLLWYQGPEGKWGKLWQILPKNGDKEVSEILNEAEQKTFALASSVSSRFWQARGMHKPARFMSKYQNNVFVYDFQWGGTKGSKVDFVLGASHVNEIGYFYYGGKWDWLGQGASLTKDNEKAREALAHAMQTYLAQFLHTGTPNGEADLPKWEAWSNDPDGVKTMNLDTSSEPGSSELKVFMTKREYIQDDLIKELEDSKDETAYKWIKIITPSSFVKKECN